MGCVLKSPTTDGRSDLCMSNNFTFIILKSDYSVFVSVELSYLPRNCNIAYVVSLCISGKALKYIFFPSTDIKTKPSVWLVFAHYILYCYMVFYVSYK